MAPSKFQIYVDNSMRQPAPAPCQQTISQPPPPLPRPSNPPVDSEVAPTNNPSNAPDQPLRYKPESLPANSRFYFDERKLYPIDGGEFSFEELNFFHWVKSQKQLAERLRLEEIERENEKLRQKVEQLSQQLTLLVNAQKQNTAPQCLPPPQNRLSIVPQSLQPTVDEDPDESQYGAFMEAASVVQANWRNIIGLDVTRTQQHDKFTLPIDQSQYIRDNVPTSTPASKRPDSGNDDENKRAGFNRRFSRPSMGGSPTLKLSPITETSRDCNSKSSSSSSTAMSCTPSTTKRALMEPIVEPVAIDVQDDRPLDPNDPSTYRRLLTSLPEPLDRRSGFFRLNRSLPKIRQGACFQAGSDAYLVDKELSHEAKMFTAQLLVDDSNDSSDIPIKTVCFRVDQPANEWLYYICNELHRRLVKQKTEPDIELSVMIANPAVMYSDGSVLVDEYFRSVAAYITLELIQLIRQIHTCDIIHMNVDPKNLLITCCPTRDDIANVDKRTSIVKLIGFDRAMDTRLLPSDFKFETRLDGFETCEMLDSKPWTFEIDWFGALSCIYKMFFLEDMKVSKDDKGRWTVEKPFKGNFPTNVWDTLFDELLNISDKTSVISVLDAATEELAVWVKANLSFVLKESDSLDRILEEYCKATNKSVRT